MQPVGKSQEMQQARRVLPPTHFLVHARADVAEAARFQYELQLRGLRVWRDITDLPAGSHTRETIERAIAEEVDGVILFTTPVMLTRPFIWDIEVPAAVARWYRERTFPITPIFHHVSADELSAHCREHELPPLGGFNGAFVPRFQHDDTAEEVAAALQAAARMVLNAAVTAHLGQAADEAYVPRLCFRTFEYDPGGAIDLDVDWTAGFDGTSPAPVTWEKQLLPALQDIKRTLSGHLPNRTIQIAVQARLPAALALGALFPASADLTLLVEHRGQVWNSTAPRPTRPVLERSMSSHRGDPDVAIVELAISRETRTAVQNTLTAQGISCRAAVRMAPNGGPHREAVSNATTAAAMAYEVGTELRRLRDELGIRHVHLFAAMPASLAVLLGHQLNATPPVTIYHTDGDAEYVPAYTLETSTSGGTT